MNRGYLIVTFGLIVIVPAVLLAAVGSDADIVLGKLSANDPLDEDKPTAGSVRVAAIPAYAAQFPGWNKRPDPFADYGHFRFGKRAQQPVQPSFADYGHLRFGRRGPSQPSYADYGHLRFGRSVGRSVDEADIYQHDFDDINDAE